MCDTTLFRNRFVGVGTLLAAKCSSFFPSLSSSSSSDFHSSHSKHESMHTRNIRTDKHVRNGIKDGKRAWNGQMILRYTYIEGGKESKPCVCVQISKVFWRGNKIDQCQTKRIHQIDVMTWIRQRRKTSTGENDSRIINVYWNAVDHLSNISFSVAVSLLCNFPLSQSLVFISSFCCCHLPHIVLFSGAVFCSTVVNSYFLMLPLHVFTVCMSPREFYFILFFFLLMLLSFHSFSLNENDRKKAFTRTWFKCSVSLSVCE